MADVAGIINRLAPLIGEKVKNEYNLWNNSKTEATKLYFNLNEIQKLLEEAERRRLMDPRVKTWLENLQNVTYEIDDALDEWEFLDLQQQFEGSDEDDISYTWLEKVSIFIDSLCSCSNIVFRRRRMAFKIKELNEKVESLGEERAKYTLLPITSDSQDIKCEITTSFRDLIDVPSQQKCKKSLVDALLTEGQEPGDIQLISLVGMVGVGKTTLAQLAFNDSKVQSGFKLRLWICVSHISNMVQLTKAILQSLHVSYHEDAELQTLLDHIQQSLFERKFLLVLDHVRIEDDIIWNQLKASLKYGAPDSRIVVTTRNRSIPNLVGSTQVIEVYTLNKEDCWLLFSRIALSGKSEADKDILEGIGREIARKCEGLPLAAKTLGYYLQSRQSKELWENVLEKEVWQLDEVAKALFATLAFSYNELPLALKHCFSFWATFKKGHSVLMDEVIRMWMVQGYTETDLTGLDHFEKLARSSFLRKSHKPRWGQCYKMHSILHDFAHHTKNAGSKVEERCIFYSDKWLSQNELDRLKSVRILIMTCKEMEKLPLEVGNLVHLRYLGLRQTRINQLPETICTLYRLQELDLRGCSQLSKLPNQIHRLRNLRHLLISASGLVQLPQGLGKLTNLQTLDQFSVGRKANKFGYLAKFDQLRGFIKIIIIGKLNEKEDVDDAEKANLRAKVHIKDLELSFKGEASMDVMEALQVPPNLQSLKILSYKGAQFPSWISNTSLDKLRELKLNKCHNCSELPPLGRLPFLEILTVQHMDSLKYVGHESIVGASNQYLFPKLRKLHFEDCDSWEEWQDVAEDEASKFSIMPFLKELFLQKCPNLKALPNLLLRKATFLKELTIKKSGHLSERYQPDSPDWKFIFQNQQS